MSNIAHLEADALLSASATKGNAAPIAILAIAAFVIVTTEFLIVGMLPALARDLHIGVTSITAWGARQCGGCIGSDRSWCLTDWQTVTGQRFERFSRTCLTNHFAYNKPE